MDPIHHGQKSRPLVQPLPERDVTVALHLQELRHVLKPRREQAFGPIRHSIHHGPAGPKLVAEPGLGRECAPLGRDSSSSYSMKQPSSSTVI